MSEPMRIIVKARVSDIPGNPQARHIALGDAVCRDLLSRKFESTPRPTLYDHIHIPGDFDSNRPLNRWFIFDLNVSEPLSWSDLTQLPHRVYLASRQNGEWVFIRRDSWTERARSETASFTWGGHPEQKVVAEMENQSEWVHNASHDAS